MYKEEKIIAVKIMEPDDDELNGIKEQAKILSKNEFCQFL